MEKPRKTNVVFVHPDLGIGGAERLVLDVAIALGKKNNTVSFVTNHFNKNHAFQELQKDQFPVRVIGDWLPRSVCGIFQALCAYVRMVFLSLIQVLTIKVKPDIYFIDQIPIAVPFIKWAGGKVIYYCHHPDLLASPPGGSLKRLYRLPIDWLELKGTAMADVILVNSKYTASVFHETFPQITKAIEILYPTISSSYQDTIAQQQPKLISTLIPELESIKNTFVFLSINRFHPAKKLELALDALSALQTKVSFEDWARVHLIIAGGYDPNSSVNASYFNQLVKLSESLGLSNKVTFLKSPSDDLKADLLLSCDCLVYTPINEHFGIVPLEAMTAAKPVIACNSGGPCETVLDGITGYLCEPTLEGLSDGFNKILNNKDLVKMGLSGKERLEQYFSYDMFCTRVNDVVETAVYGQTILKVVEAAEESSSKTNMLEAVAEESPKSNDLLKTVESGPTSEEKSSLGINNKPSPIREEKSSPRNDDKPSPRSDDILSPRSNDNVSPRNEEKLSPRKEEKSSPRNDDKASPRSDDILSPGSNDKMSPRNEEKLSPRKEEKSTLRNNDKPSPREEKSSPRNNDKPSPKHDDKLSPRNEEKSSPTKESVEITESVLQDFKDEVAKECDFLLSPCDTSYLSTFDSTSDSDIFSQTEPVAALNDSGAITEN